MSLSSEDGKQVASDWFASVDHTDRVIVMIRAFLYGPRHAVLVKAIHDELRIAHEHCEKAKKILSEK